MCRTDSHKRARAAFTLIETMVAVAIGSLVVLASASFSLYLSRSYVAMTNYANLDQQGQLALDKFTQQVRQVKQLTSYATNGSGIIGLTFKDYDDQTLSFSYDSGNQCLYRIKGGATNVLLSGCSSLQFSLFQRNPQPFTFDAVTTAVATNCKLVEVTWVCSRSILQTDNANTESVQSAKVAIRSE